MKETKVNYIPYLFFVFTKEEKIIDCNQTFIHIFGYVHDLRKLLDEVSIENCFHHNKREDFREITFLNGNNATIINIEMIQENSVENYVVTAKYNNDNAQPLNAHASFNQLDLLNHFPFILFELNNQYEITHIQGEIYTILGITPQELVHFSDVVDDPSYAKLKMIFKAAKNSKESETIESEITMRVKLEHFQVYIKKLLNTFVLVISPFPKDYFSMAETMMSQYSSLSQLSTELMKKNQLIGKQKDEFESLSKIDSLTGLFNRRNFNDVIIEEHKKATKLDCEISLILIDLNNFKQVNDLYGHHAGDQLLKKFAYISLNQIREGSDYAFRFGGDEFLITLLNCEEKYAQKVAKRIENEYKQLTNYSLSYGIVSLPCDSNLDVDKYLKIVDKRMYNNKKESKES